MKRAVDGLFYLFTLGGNHCLPTIYFTVGESTGSKGLRCRPKEPLLTDPALYTILALWRRLHYMSLCVHIKVVGGGEGVSLSPHSQVGCMNAECVVTLVWSLMWAFIWRSGSSTLFFLQLGKCKSRSLGTCGLIHLVDGCKCDYALFKRGLGLAPSCGGLLPVVCAHC